MSKKGGDHLQDRLSIERRGDLCNRISNVLTFKHRKELQNEVTQ